MGKFFRIVKSLHFALILICYLAATGILATLVPQGQENEFYFDRYPPLLAVLVVGSGLSRFFTSLPFIIPAFLFFANLSACAADRFVRERGKKTRRRHGPDIVHLGLILLFVGSVLSFTGKKEGFVNLARGDAVRLPDGRLLSLMDFKLIRYDDGRPRDWISTVRVAAGDKVQIDGYPIRVNHPLKLGRLSVYQASFGTDRVLILKDPRGAERSLARGEEAQAGEVSISLVSAEDSASTALIKVAGAKGAEVLRVGPGDRAGEFTVVGLRDLELSGLRAVMDPGFPLVILALGLAGAGIFSTFAQKLGERKP